MLGHGAAKGHQIVALIAETRYRAFAYTLGMTFWAEVLAIFLGDVLASALLVLLYALVQWFLRATDITIGYGWKWERSEFLPKF